MSTFTEVDLLSRKQSARKLFNDELRKELQFRKMEAVSDIRTPATARRIVETVVHYCMLKHNNVLEQYRQKLVGYRSRFAARMAASKMSSQGEEAISDTADSAAHWPSVEDSIRHTEQLEEQLRRQVQFCGDLEQSLRDAAMEHPHLRALLRERPLSQ